MPEATYDILFAGNLLDGAEPERVKRNLKERFNLTDAQVERLFAGQRVVIKRGVDIGTATRYRELFHQAGALAQIVKVEAGERAVAPPSAPAAPTSTVAPQPASAATTPSSWLTGAWELAPPGAALEELGPTEPPRHPNIAHLSLVEEDNWTLEDCAPPPLPQPLPDLDSLALEPLAPRPPAPERDIAD